MKFKLSDTLNSNEIIADYDFFLQLIQEEKELDCEMESA